MDNATENGTMPAMPMDNISSARAEEGYFDPFAYGMTKREQFAMAAMQNILSRFNPYEYGDFDSSNYDETATHAVFLADALLNALETNNG